MDESGLERLREYQTGEDMRWFDDPEAVASYEEWLRMCDREDRYDD